jgi:hypothetical protein
MTWANVPDVNITSSSVTQHQAALSITESQISDFQSYQLLSQKGSANGYASLDTGGKVPTTQLPALALTEVSVVADQAARLALTAQEGDVAIQTDISTTFIHNGGTAGTTADWNIIEAPVTEVDPVFTAHTTNNITDGTGFLKNNGSGVWSYDNATYLTASDPTLASVTTNGNTTTNAITVGTFTSTGIDDNATSTAITIDASENVGIGATSPKTALDIIDASAARIYLGTDASNYGGLVYSGGVMNMRGFGTGTAAVVSADATNSKITFTTAGVADRVTIDSNGNVSIGAGGNIPDSRLHIGDTAPVFTIEDTSASTLINSAGSVEFQRQSGFVYGGLYNVAATSELKLGTNFGSGFLTFATDNDVERMRIDASGDLNLGLTTGTPTGGVTLQNGAGVKSGPVMSIGGTDTAVVTGDTIGALAFVTADGSYTGTYADGIGAQIAAVAETAVGGGYGLAFTTGVTTGSNRAERMRIKYDGNVGIGTSIPNTILDIEEGAPVLRMTATTTTGTTLGNKGAKLLMQSDSSTAGNGGEIVWTGDGDATTERWAAISGHIDINSVNGCAGSIVFANKENDTDTTLTERMRIHKDGSVYWGDSGFIGNASAGRFNFSDGTTAAGGAAIATFQRRSKVGWDGSRTSMVIGTTDVASARSIEFDTNAEGAVTFAGDGKVGIGTGSNIDTLLHIQSAGPAVLKIEADTDNVTETDNAGIILSQDANQVVARLGFNSGGNSLELINEFNENVFIGVNNTTNLTINATSGITSTLNITAPGATLTGLSNQASEGTALMINGSNVVGTRELGSNAFNSTAFTTNTGTVTSVAAGNGMDFTSITTTGSVTLGTPGTLTASTTNATTATSHTHAITGFVPLTGSDSLTGGLSTTGTYFEVGRGSGSVAMTTNDGDGNANLTFNHRNGDADGAGNVGRIEVNVDSTSGATMYFEVQDNAATGAITINNTGMTLTRSSLTINNNGTAGGGALSAGTLALTGLSNQASEATALVINGFTVGTRELGSNAFNSTAYLPLTGGTVTGAITAPTFVASSTTYTTTTDFAVEANGVIRSGTGLWVAGNGLNFGTTTTNSPTSGYDANVTTRMAIDNIGQITLTPTDTTADSNVNGLILDLNPSGSDVLTADRTHRGIFVDIDSSATGGDISNEHRLYGVMADVRATGDSDLIHGGYFYARSDHSAGTITNLYGSLNYAIAHSNAGGTVTNARAAYNIAYNSNVEAVTNVIGTDSLASCTATGNANVTNLEGVRSEVDTDAAYTGTVTNAYAVRATVDNNTGSSASITNSYLFYGDYQGVLPGTPYGVYIADDVDNYFRGTIVSAESSNADILRWSNTGYLKRLTTQGGFFLGGDSSGIVHAGDQEAGLRTALGIDNSTTTENLYFVADNNVEIRTNWQDVGNSNDRTWTFDTDGTLTAPGDILASYIGTNTSPATDDLKVNGYGILGNRSSAVYLTNAGTGGVQIGAGGVHNASPIATFNTTGVSIASGGLTSGEINFPGGSKIDASGTLQGDFYARRDNGSTGVYYFVDGGDKYLYWDGGKYVFGGTHDVYSSGDLNVATVTASTGGTNTLIAINNNFTYHNDLDRNANSANYYPNAIPKGHTFRFVNASSVGTGGNYAGMLHFAPWVGTTASTGDASYQLVFGSTGSNGGGVPDLRIRKGIDTTWNSFHDIFHSGAINKIESTSNLIYEESSIGGFIPVLAQKLNNGQTQTGAIKLGFGSSPTADMICGWVDIYNYTADDTVSIFIGGYLYQGAGQNEWVSESVTTFTNNTSQDFTVRFGHDGTQHCIYIGELASTWAYSQITARDWTVGYTSDVDVYATGPTITYEATAFQNVDATKTGNLPVASSAAACTGNSATVTLNAENDSDNTARDMLYAIGSNVHRTSNVTYNGSQDLFKVISGARFEGATTVVNTLTIQGTGSNLDMLGSAPATDARYLYLPRGGGITLYGNAEINHGIFSRDLTGAVSDDVRINSYGGVSIILDTNSNNSSGADFHIGRHSTTTADLGFVVSGETYDVTTEGNLTAYGTVSDIRYKEDIEKIDSPVERLQKINGVTFKYKEKEDRLMGVIAQELLEDDILKLAVYENETIQTKEKRYAVRYEHLTAMLIEAIKEQQKQIDELKEMIK